jgi:hypothetical protein
MRLADANAGEARHRRGQAPGQDLSRMTGMARLRRPSLSARRLGADWSETERSAPTRAHGSSRVLSRSARGSAWQHLVRRSAALYP